MANNDKEFKAELGALPIAQQRQVASLFVQRVFPLSNEVRLKSALEVAQRADVSDVELVGAYQAANTARVESFTQCGRTTDWAAQAGHFVAKATVSCVRAASTGENLAWESAMSARMARTCETVAKGFGTENTEAQEQYRILASFIESLRK